MYNKLKIPEAWKEYYSKYPNGLSILEALISWASQVDSMVDVMNNWTTYLDNFVQQFEFDLQVKVTETLNEWYTSGFLATIISAAIGNQFAVLEGKITQIEEDLEKVSQTINVTAYGAVGDGITDDTLAIQTAINYCIANNRDLIIPTMCRITAPLNIDRLVDGASFDSYFTIFSNSGGGIFVDTAITLFSSTIPYTTTPVTQLIRFKNLKFVASDTALDAYVLHGPRFLRTIFDGCSFSKIKCMLATTYVQSIYFINCNVRRWTGTFFKASPQGYDIQVIGGLYEAGTGDCFDISSPIGCKFWTQIEGMSGTALKINGAQGVDISCYFEANGIDIDCRTGGLSNQGINLHGSYISHGQNAMYSVIWGQCAGCVSQGNWHTNNMHDLQSDSMVSINDFAQTNLSNTSDAKTNIGYREGNTPPLRIRTSNSDSYTVSDLVSKFTRMGNRVNIEFKATLTSTASNPADMIYIPSTFPYDAEVSGLLCGQVEVLGVGYLENSPLNIASASPMRVQSSGNVIPTNTSGNTFTVRGYISYLVAS